MLLGAQTSTGLQQKVKECLSARSEIKKMLSSQACCLQSQAVEPAQIKTKVRNGMMQKQLKTKAVQGFLSLPSFHST